MLQVNIVNSIAVQRAALQHLVSYLGFEAAGHMCDNVMLIFAGTASASAYAAASASGRRLLGGLILLLLLMHLRCCAIFRIICIPQAGIFAFI